MRPGSIALFFLVIFVVSVWRLATSFTGHEYVAKVVTCSGSRNPRCKVQVEAPSSFSLYVEKPWFSSMEPGMTVTVYGTPNNLEANRVPLTAIFGVVLPVVVGLVSLILRRETAALRHAQASGHEDEPPSSA